MIKTTKKLESFAEEIDSEQLTSYQSIIKGFELCLEELEMDIISFEDDWNRNPQAAFELFKSKYIK